MNYEKGTWTASDNEERFPYYGCATKEEAIKKAIEEYDLKEGDQVCVGWVNTITRELLLESISFFSADHIMDMLSDEFGEVAAEWLSDMTGNEEREIEEAVLDMIIKKRPLTNFIVEDLEWVTV